MAASSGSMEAAEIPEDILKNFSLIWCDDGTQNKVYSAVKDKLCVFSKSFRMITSVKELRTFAKRSSEDMKICLIISERMARDAVSLVHDLDHFIVIYIFPIEGGADCRWTKEYGKVKVFKGDSEELVSAIECDFTQQINEIKLARTQISEVCSKSNEPISSEEKTYYNECKNYYRLTGMPLISIADEILSTNIPLTSVAFKLVIDEDYNAFDIEKCLEKICKILNVERHDIDIKKIQDGSVVLELELWKNFAAILKKIKIKALYHALTDKVRAEMGKLQIFFMFMGDIGSCQNMLRIRQEIKLNPQWNRIYGMAHTYWTGALQDGRDRGPHPYYCPNGWKRYAFHVGDNYDAKFKGWSFCYHGTKFSYGLSILLSGLKPARRAQHGQGIYASPSVIYACHPRYAEVRKIESSEETNFFQHGKYVQFVLQCRVHPSNIKTIGPETLEAGNTIIDSNVKNNIIEWVIDTKDKDMVDFNDTDATIVCTSMMLRVTDNHPGLLPESKWWYSSHLCNNSNCCALGIDLNVLTAKKIIKKHVTLFFHE